MAAASSTAALFAQLSVQRARQSDGADVDVLAKDLDEVLTTHFTHKSRDSDTPKLRWPGDSQCESGRFARIDSQKNPVFS